VPPWEAHAAKADVPMEELHITSELWEETLNSLPKNKAPGHDGITYDMIRLMPPRPAHLLRMLLNACLKRNIIPRRWKQMRTLMLHKGGSRATLDNYRQIVLSNVFLRLLDKCVSRLLREYVTKNRLLSPLQFGFQAEKSVHQAHLIIEAVIDYCRRNKKSLALMPLDIRKAFPSCAWTVLHARLTGAGMSTISRYISSLYEGANNYIVVGRHKSATGHYAAGVMEGLSTSALLFALYIDPLIRWIESAQQLGVSMSATDPLARRPRVPARGQQWPQRETIETRLACSFFADDGILVDSSLDGIKSLLQMVSAYGHYNNYNPKPSKTALYLYRIDIPTEEEDKVKVTERYLHPLDRESGGHIATFDKRGVFRHLGFFRSIVDMAQPHHGVLEERVTHALYAIQRCGLSGYNDYLISKAINSNVISLFRFAASAVYMSPSWIEKMQRRITIVMAKVYRLKHRFPHVILLNHEAFLHRKLQDEVDAAVLGNLFKALNGSEKLREVYQINYLNKEQSTAMAPPWACPTAPWLVRGSIDVVTAVLARRGISASFGPGEKAGYHWTRSKFVAGRRRDDGRIGHNVTIATNNQQLKHTPGFIAATGNGHANMAAREVRYVDEAKNPRGLQGRVHDGFPNGNVAIQERYIQVDAVGRHNRVTAKIASAWDEWRLTFCHPDGTLHAHLQQHYDDTYSVSPELRIDGHGVTARVAIVPSAKAIHGVRGDQRAGAVAHSFDLRECFLLVKPDSTQSCGHAVVVALIQTLARVHNTPRIIISVPMQHVTMQLNKWQTMSERKRSTHPYRTTMEIAVALIHASTAVVTIETRATNELVSFDGRYTRDMINTNPRRWIDGEEPGTVREWAADARDLPACPILMSKTTKGLVLHDQQKTMLYEGDAGKIITKISDREALEALKTYPRTEEYMQERWHPLTIALFKKHRNRTFIWRARADVLPLASNAIEWDFPPHPAAGYHCMCSEEGDPQGETIGHMLLTCPLYADIREKGPPPYKIELDEENTARVESDRRCIEVARCLGAIPEIPPRPKGDHKINIQIARASVITALEIWRKRNRIREEAEARINANNNGPQTGEDGSDDSESN